MSRSRTSTCAVVIAPVSIASQSREGALRAVSPSRRAPGAPMPKGTPTARPSSSQWPEPAQGAAHSSVFSRKRYYPAPHAVAMAVAADISHCAPSALRGKARRAFRSFPLRKPAFARLRSRASPQDLVGRLRRPEEGSRSTEAAQDKKRLVESMSHQRMRPPTRTRPLISAMRNSPSGKKPAANGSRFSQIFNGRSVKILEALLESMNLV